MRRFTLGFNWLNILLGINIVLFILAYFFSPSLLCDLNYKMIGALVTSDVLQGSFWLLITSTFLHINIFHFIFNIFSLFSVGKIVDTFYNKKTILLTYIIAGLAGSLLTVFVSLITRIPIISIGASASVFGLIGLLLGGTIRKRRYGVGLPFNASDLLPSIIIAFLIGFIPSLHVNNWAHLGGFVAGVILGLIVKNEVGDYRSKADKIIEKGLYYSSLVILIVSAVAWILNFYYIIFLSNMQC